MLTSIQIPAAQKLVVPQSINLPHFKERCIDSLRCVLRRLPCRHDGVALLGMLSVPEATEPSYDLIVNLEGH